MAGLPEYRPTKMSTTLLSWPNKYPPPRSLYVWRVYSLSLCRGESVGKGFRVPCLFMMFHYGQRLWCLRVLCGINRLFPSCPTFLFLALDMHTHMHTHAHTYRYCQGTQKRSDYETNETSRLFDKQRWVSGIFMALLLSLRGAGRVCIVIAAPCL